MINYSIVEIDGVQTTTAGELKVATPEPVAPPNTIAVYRQYIGEHNGTEYNEYEIPNGKKLTIQKLYAGAQEKGDGSYARIVDRGLDNNQWDDIVIPLFVSGSTSSIDVNVTLEASGDPGGTGNESRWIEMLMINDRRCYCGCKWVGYLEDI